MIKYSGLNILETHADSPVVESTIHCEIYWAHYHYTDKYLCTVKSTVHSNTSKTICFFQKEH